MGVTVTVYVRSALFRCVRPPPPSTFVRVCLSLQNISDNVRFPTNAYITRTNQPPPSLSLSSGRQILDNMSDKPQCPDAPTKRQQVDTLTQLIHNIARREQQRPVVPGLGILSRRESSEDCAQTAVRRDTGVSNNLNEDVSMLTRPSSTVVFTSP